MTNSDVTAIVYAVVVTYNRKDLLLECLDALHRQTFPVQKIILIDNASTDGTKDAVDRLGYNNIQYILMETNTGGAGGFYQGLKQARDEACDWVWVMDDDTIPKPDSLEKLIEGIGKIREKKKYPIGFVASAVYGPRGEYMNVPVVSTAPSPNGYWGWYDMLEQGIVAVERATFVSILINKNAVIKCGLPFRDYYIWGDDTEYTQRITKYYGPAYLIGSSVVIHKRFNTSLLRIEKEENKDRLPLYHYFYRNRAINARLYLEKNAGYLFLQGLNDARRLLGKDSGLMKAGIVIKGNVEAITQYNKFKQYIEGQIAEDIME